jgi:predicted permease
MQGHRTLSARRSTFSKSLLVAQVAMSIMLLIGAGLFVQTLRNLQSGELGFDPTNLLLFKIDPTLNNYEGVQYNRIVEHVIERLESLDGVRAATVSNNALIGGGGNSMGVADKNGLSVSATFMGAGSDFFAQMGIPIVLGRSFGPQDHAGAPAVVVINETLARRYFQNTNPIGKQVWDKEIIGVVRDTQFRNLRAQTPAFIFSHIVQEAPRQTTFAVRTAGDPSALVPAIRETVKQVDSNLPIYDIRTQEEQIQLTLVRERLFANFASAFGALALFLVCVGLYGVMSYNVMRRTHEIGIRMSLGAKPSKVLGMVMRETLLLVIGGVALGLALALALTRRIESVLFGLEPNDPVIIGIAILVIVATAAFSGYLPARRASRVDPMEALRYQ